MRAPDLFAARLALELGHQRRKFVQRLTQVFARRFIVRRQRDGAHGGLHLDAGTYRLAHRDGIRQDDILRHLEMPLTETVTTMAARAMPKV